MEGVKRISIREFRKAGYLQELNRQFLHPIGLALEVVVGDDGTEALGGVRDHRDDPEGIQFGYAAAAFAAPDHLLMARKKAEFVRQEQARRRPLRKGGLGFWIEPLGDEE